MKMFVCDYHLNDQTTFLHHQIQVCSAHAHARILDLGNKNAFSVLHMHGLMIFQHHEFMKTEMSKFATQQQKLPLSLETQKSSFLSDQRHLTT